MRRSTYHLEAFPAAVLPLWHYCIRLFANFVQPDKEEEYAFSFSLLIPAFFDAVVRVVPLLAKKTTEFEYCSLPSCRCGTDFLLGTVASDRKLLEWDARREVRGRVGAVESHRWKDTRTRPQSQCAAKYTYVYTRTIYIYI